MSNYESLQRKRNFTVGIFAVAAICALMWLVYKFEDLPIRIGELRSFQMFVQFPTASGVQEKTAVRFCGYQIGRVSHVKPPEILKDLNSGQFYHQTVVVLKIDRKYDNIPANSEVKLMSRGLGSSYIELKAPPFDVKEPDGDFLGPGALLQGSTGVTSEFFPEGSQKKLEQLVDSLQILIRNANDIIGDPENKENLKSTLASLSEATEQATSSLKEFQNFSAAGAKTLGSAEVGLQRVFDSIVDTSIELKSATAQMRQIMEKVNSGQGSAGKFVNDGRLYENLLENSEQVQVLLEELKLFVAELPDKGVPIKLK